MPSLPSFLNCSNWVDIDQLSNSILLYYLIDSYKNNKVSLSQSKQLIQAGKELDKKRVLLVDDDEIYLSIIGEILKDKYEVITANSGKGAMEHLHKEFVPDLILLDILMPDLDGWETFIRIRAINSLQDVPIMFLTSIVESAEVKHAQELGAADYVTKPYKIENLLNRIERILRK
jgi:CheY-like chemotaxis protein